MQPTKPTTKVYLQEGDVFAAKKSYKVELYAIPEKYIFSNRRNSPNEYHTIEKMGAILTCPNAPDFNIWAKFKGDYLVIRTNYTGGGSGMGPNDDYPNGHEVTALKLDRNGRYDPYGEKIRFYQSGCFNNQIDELIPVKRRMINTWI